MVRRPARTRNRQIYRSRTVKKVTATSNREFVRFEQLPELAAWHAPGWVIKIARLRPQHQPVRLVSAAAAGPVSPRHPHGDKRNLIAERPANLHNAKQQEHNLQLKVQFAHWQHGPAELKRHTSTAARLKAQHQATALAAIDLVIVIVASRQLIAAIPDQVQSAHKQEVLRVSERPANITDPQQWSVVDFVIELRSIKPALACLHLRALALKRSKVKQLHPIVEPVTVPIEERQQWVFAHIWKWVFVQDQLDQFQLAAIKQLLTV